LYSINNLHFKKISPLKLNIARYHFKRTNPDNKKGNNYEINSEKNFEIITEKNDLNSNFPPKKPKVIDNELIAEKNEYDGRNSDNKILKSYSKEKLNNNNYKSKKISKFSKKIWANKENISEDLILTKLGKLDNFELNNLEYEDALILDQRNFWQIYWSLLKRENILLFTFYFHNDYNLYYVKNARFIFLLATDMAMNVFFFADETMNKLYLSYGEYDFVQQIPQIVYSKLTSIILETFLCYLSLTDKHYYQIKALTKSDKVEIFKIIKCTRIKLVIFFVFTFIIFLFYLYLVTAFCAVYENTEIVYIKDSLSSFAFGLLLSLIIYLLPTSL